MSRQRGITERIACTLHGGVSVAVYRNIITSLNGHAILMLTLLKSKFTAYVDGKNGEIITVKSNSKTEQYSQYLCE